MLKYNFVIKKYGKLQFVRSVFLRNNVLKQGYLPQKRMFCAKSQKNNLKSLK